MPRYTNDSRERVRDAVDFAELVGARTELKRAGMNRLQGLCPFHEERTPSFGIDPTEKLYNSPGATEAGVVHAPDGSSLPARMAVMRSAALSVRVMTCGLDRWRVATMKVGYP